MPSLRQLQGRAAEQCVVGYLQSHGFELLGTNVQVGHLELDIVALQDRVVCVIEVRHRGPGAWQTAFGSIDAVKRARIRRAGERLWRRRYRNDPRVDRMRFDAVAVYETGQGWCVEHAPAAF